MLKKQNRLGKIVKTKRNNLFISPLFNLRISDNKENKIRFGFIVSKKIDKRAVIRNQTKRVLRSAVEELIDRLVLGKDIVVIPRGPLIPEQTKEIEKKLEEIFKNTKLINE
jgi:ribonuclease P protein component